MDGNKLQNKKETWLSDEEIWKSTEEWSFKTYDHVTAYIIENNSKKKVLEAANNGDVILKNFKYGKVEQLWKTGVLKDAKGYFSLRTSRFCTWVNGGCKNSSAPKILTATSKQKMKIKGKITLRKLNIHSQT